jgi:FAD/FMN-containing dehydrogenase
MYRPSARTLDRDARIAGWLARRAGMEPRVERSLDALIALQRRFHGALVLPGDTTYPQARQLSSPAYQAFPLAIAQCEIAGDVRAALAAARAHDWWVVCRAGGHSSAGFSVNSGLVIDVSRLSHVDVDPAAGTVTAGGGTSFQTLNAALDAYGLHLVGGGCDDVCVGGYVQGGGYGFTSLAYGMESDSCIAARVMLADGSEVVASATENADLFWAIRGGTGNNFGIVIDATFRTVPLGTLWGFALSWPIEKAPDALIALQTRFMRQPVSSLLGFQGMVAKKNGQTQLGIAGIVNGSPEEGRRLIAPLVEGLGAQLASDMTGSYVELNEKLIIAICPVPVPAPGFSELKRAGYISRVLTADEWRRLFAYYETTPLSWNVMIMEAYGGAIIAPAPGDTAFMHRDAYMDLCVEAAWTAESDRDASVAWLNGFHAEMASCVNGHVYQNYPHRDAPNYRWMYWGDNFPTLLWIKQKYDPDNVFHFAQSVSPYPGDAGSEVKRSSSPSRFSDSSIVYRYRAAAPRS